jgi:PAS domain S-box-containing protein
METRTLAPETRTYKRDAARLVLIGLAYFLAQELAFLYPDTQQLLTAIWPAGGIGLAAFLLSPRRLWPAIAAVIFAASAGAIFLEGRTVAISVGFSAANTLESVACGWLLSCWCGPDVRFERVTETLALFAVAVFVNAATALIGAIPVLLANTSRFRAFWFNWWIEDALGILLVTPLIMAWRDFRDVFRELRWRHLLEAVLLMVLLSAAARVAFQPGDTLPALAIHPYMLIALLAWSGLRFGQRGMVLALALLAAIAVTGKGVTAGPSSLGGATMAERLLGVQIYLALISSIGLLMAAAYAESRSAEARIRALGDNLPQGAVYQSTSDRDGRRRFLYVSAGMEKLTGVPVEEILRDGSVFDNLVVEEDRLGFAAAEQAALDNRTVFQAVIRMRRRDGRIRWMHLTSSPRDLGDERIIWDGIQTDVTERKQAEDDLQAANAELTAIHAHAPVSLLSVGEDLRVRTVRDLPGAGLPGCLSALADPAQCGAKPDCAQCPVRLAVLDSLRNRTRHESIEAWLPVTTQDRTRTRCFLVFTGPLELRDSRRALVCLLDITDSKRAEMDLRSSEARFRTLTEEAPIAISISRGGQMVFANPTYLKMFGFQSAAELEGRPTLDLFAPQCRVDVTERGLRRSQGLPVPTEYESIGLRRDGSEFPMLVGVINMQFDEGPALVAFITDLTEWKRSEDERAKLEKQLRQAQKLESIGRLAGGVAHDFNNFLTVINGFSALLSRRLNPHDPLWSYAEQVRKAGERGAGLTRQLLAFSRQEVIKPVPVNLNTSIADSEQMILSLVGEHIELVLNLDAHLGQVLVDPAQIDQVILNLVANARDAMPRGGRLEIATRNIDKKENEASASGRWVSVTVTDTGAGMDEATRQNIFEPFFTTKEVGEGTGLGLATVYGVMQQNAGWIDVNSEPGAGTSFGLYFPRIDERAIVPAARVNGLREAPGGETILLVEDQEAVRDFLRAVLEDCGYKVVEAGNGAEALIAAAAHADEIRLLVTDVIMPGMNGRELAERLILERPSLKTIFMSGYLADVIAHSGVLDGDVAFIQKPVTPETLAAKVRDVLAG